jgi:hypothetical protein
MTGSRNRLPVTVMEDICSFARTEVCAAQEWSVAVPASLYHRLRKDGMATPAPLHSPWYFWEFAFSSN